MNTHKKGDKVKMTNEALENYGEKYRDVELTVSHVATRYMPASDFYAKGRPDGYHPGFDESVKGQRLYDFEELNFSLYDWELQ